MSIEESTDLAIDLSRLKPWEFESFLEALLDLKGFERLLWTRDSLISLRAERPRSDQGSREVWLIQIWDPFKVIREIAISSRIGLRSSRFFDNLRSLLDLGKPFFSGARVLIVLGGYFSKELFADLPEDLAGSPIEIWDIFDLQRETRRYPQLLRMLAELEERRLRRDSGERDAIWLDISSVVAHKLGNPISAIEGYLDPLGKRISDGRRDEALEILGKIRASVERAKDYIYQFKDLARAQELRPELMMLRPLLEEVCRSEEQKGVSVDLFCEADVKIWVDPRSLVEVFEELFSNSYRCTPPGDRRIQIRVNQDLNTREVQIFFRDNGPGVNPEDKLRIFEFAFTTNPQGRGLGLYVVRTIVEGHHGQVSEIGEDGQGAVFLLRLPILEPIAVELGQP